MAILDIVKAGAPVLKEIAAPVERIDTSIRRLLDDMAETMYAADGIGLAAPQVGKSIRVVVIDVGDGLFELINPRITFKDGSVVDSEGCLSCPNLFGDVERAETVKIVYRDRRNKQKNLTAKGLLARCIQHELDHLDGILFIDIARSIRPPEEKQEA